MVHTKQRKSVSEYPCIFVSACMQRFSVASFVYVLCIWILTCPGQTYTHSRIINDINMHVHTRILARELDMAHTSWKSQYTDKQAAWKFRTSPTMTLKPYRLRSLDVLCHSTRVCIGSRAIWSYFLLHKSRLDGPTNPPNTSEAARCSTSLA